ncbi:De-etiolated protein 1 Det1-domain-containing protein [Chytridium lagenaria]|nr:De-etiolated protein 1 Det1-domain-containing protein [Chytridium lagenaria]
MKRPVDCDNLEPPEKHLRLSRTGTSHEEILGSRINLGPGEPRVSPLDRNDALLQYLHRRETGARIDRNFLKTAYRFVAPKTSIRQARVPDVALKKFTPCGKYLVAFSMNQHAVQLYWYNGPGGKPFQTNRGQEFSEEAAVFESFFSLSHELLLTAGPELVCKDFCMFDSSGTLMILASARPSLGYNGRPMFPTSLNTFPDTDDITFWLIDILAGKVLDKITYCGDFILLANHAGVSIHNDVLAITSVQNQCIFLVLIKSKSSFVSIRTVGWHNYEDDGLLIEEAINAEIQYGGPQLGEGTDQILSGIRHRLMVYLFKKARQMGTIKAMSHFHMMFQQFSTMIMWRAQFLDQTHLLIKLGSSDNELDRHSEPSYIQNYFFLIYSLDTTEIVHFLENTTMGLERTLQEMFGSYSGPTHSHVTTFFNNEYAKDSMLRQFEALRKAKNGGYAYACRRALSIFPINLHCISESPYFDHNLFHYDEKMISHHERVRACVESPVRIWDRATGGLLFRIDSNSNPQESDRNSFEAARQTKKYALYIFHPTDPFVMTIQWVSMNESSVNFHVLRPPVPISH